MSYDPFAKILGGIKECKSLAQDLYNLSAKMCDAEQKYYEALAAVERVHDCPELERLKDRLHEITAVRRTLELGAFVLQTNNAMEAAYKKLP